MELLGQSLCIFEGVYVCVCVCVCVCMQGLVIHFAKLYDWILVSFLIPHSVGFQGLEVGA